MVEIHSQKEVNSYMGKTYLKKKAKQKAVSKNTSSRKHTWGFDYGLPFRAAAIGSIDFNQKLRAADIIAVAYGIEHSAELDCPVPALSLVGRNEEPLRQAFEEFARWAESSDADAVDVDLVFLKSGGYRLMISPEPMALIHRSLKYNAVFDPISFQISWIKPIDAVSEPLRQLRSHLIRGIKPYILSAAIYTGIAAPGMAPVRELIRTVRGIKQLLKFKIRFADEGEKAGEDLVKMALLNANGKPKGKTTTKDSYLPSPESLRAARMHRLKTLFPVTIWRAENKATLKEVCEAAEHFGLLKWQVQQALCNTLVSCEITNGLPHFEGIKQKDWPGTLVAKLGQRYEIADGRNELSIPVRPEELVRQATLDASALLKGYGLKRVPDNIEMIQKELLKRNLLAGA